MPPRIRYDCSIPGCDRPHAGRGYCKFHWKRWRLYGDPLREPAPVVPSVCSITGCNDIATKRGMCDTHYHRVRSWGDADVVKKVKTYGNRRCAAEACQRPARSRGLCPMHRKRQTKHGDLAAGRSTVGYVNRGGYRVIPVNGQKVLEHRHVWTSIHGPIPRGYVIHHIDGIKLNNAPENLALMRRSEHGVLHNASASPNGLHWCARCSRHLPRDAFYLRRTPKGSVPSGYCRACLRARVSTCAGCQTPTPAASQRCRRCAAASRATHRPRTSSGTWA